MFTILHSAHRTDADFKEWLLATYGISTSKDILRDDYDSIVAFIEGPEEFFPVDLLEEAIVEEREPGSDDT